MDSNELNVGSYGALVGIAIVAVICLALLGSVALSFGTVGEDEVAVETHWGEATGTTYENGQYWTGNPLLMQGYSHGTEHITVEPTTMKQSSRGLSSDGQDINAVVSVTYQVNGEQAHSFYSDSDSSGPFKSTKVWEERVGKRAIQSSIQDASASVSTLSMLKALANQEGSKISEVQNVGTLRKELQVEAEEQLRAETEKLSPEVQIIEVRVEDVQLSDELDSSLEEIATERAEAERQIIEAEADAEAERKRASGEADAFNTVVTAYGSEERALQSEWIQAINEDEGTIVLDGEAAPILDMNNVQQTESSDNSD